MIDRRELGTVAVACLLAAAVLCVYVALTG